MLHVGFRGMTGFFPGGVAKQTNVLCIFNTAPHLRRIIWWWERFLLASVGAIASDEQLNSISVCRNVGRS